MSKKPASLTSDLLARKGEAEPSSVDPVSRVTLSPGRQPGLSGIGADEGPSPALYASAATERPDMHGSDGEERPSPPEPEIIYTPEEERGGGRGRLIAGAFVGLALLAGVLVAVSLNEGGGVAPVSPDLAAAPEQAPEEAAVAEAPAAPEATAAGIAEATGTDAQGEAEMETAAAGTPTTTDMAADAPADTASETEAAAAAEPASIVPPASSAQEPASAPPAETPVAEPAAPATAAEPASGGAFVVQIMALREEAGAADAWAALQARHGGILGGHALDIERADLGDKGVFYRVRAAGFETRAAAISACENLKAAGQDCMVKAR
jgi:cell division septation protein DedD